jgi:hypothetical protein
MNTLSEASPLFPPTPRQQWVVLLSLLFLAVVSRLPGSWTFLLLISPWIVGMTIMVLDREGPVRNWLGATVHSLFYPLALVVYNGAMIEQWRRFGSLPHLVTVVLVNLLLLTCFVFFVRYFWPQRCPSCGHRSFIPLMPLLFREQRSNSTHWCASCGVQYWKKEGEWVVERRKTWWDFAKKKAKAECEQADRSGHGAPIQARDGKVGLCRSRVAGAGASASASQR